MVLPPIHPEKYEIENGCKLGIVAWKYTSSSGKYADVDGFVEGKTVVATILYSSMGSFKDLTIANVLYTYDILDVNTIPL